MVQLSLEALRSRLALDYRAMRSLRGKTLGRVQAFVSPVDILPRREATHAQGLAGLVTAYRVEYRFPMLRSHRRYMDWARAVFRIPTIGYPFTEPSVDFDPLFPFAPHISHESGTVCTGEAWGAARGTWLLANLVVHVMKLANFDEPCTEHGLNGHAVRYARRELDGQPLNPDLDYPVMDERVTHSGTPPVVSGGLFRRSSQVAKRISGTPSTSLVFARRSP